MPFRSRLEPWRLQDPQDFQGANGHIVIKASCVPTRWMYQRWHPSRESPVRVCVIYSFRVCVYVKNLESKGYQAGASA